MKLRRARAPPIHAVIVLVLLPLAVAHAVLLASLPRLDGRVHCTCKSGPVTIDRDRLGIVTVSGATRADVAYATGFVHAQDRFFQMDLTRRFASGDLGSLIGPAAASHDRLIRTFHFRRVAREALSLLSSGERQLLDAYVEGVNHGLAALPSRPWEYWILQHRPMAWHAEDTLLVVHAMWWDLQYGERARQDLRLAVNARLRGHADSVGWKSAMRFLFPARTRWDAPIDASGEAVAAVSIPGENEIDLRAVTAAPVGAAGRLSRVQASQAFPGSNNWAVSGALTTTHAALVAGDMHLRLRVPAIWYRARLRVGSTLDLNGVTLPGAPVLVAGSNGSIAWSFTNSYGHWLDTDLRTHAVHWLATNPGATNLRLADLETATSSEEALKIAPTIGIPQQNMIVGDREGHIGWTIAGRIPRGTGPSRNTAASQWLGAGEAPRILDPAAQRLWSANARVTDNALWQTMLGGTFAPIGSGYDLGARAAQIRDALAAKSPLTPFDMLEIQLDDRALLLTQWRARLLAVLDADALAESPARAQVEHLVRSWDARASITSVGYRIVRSFRDQTRWVMWQAILHSLDLDSSLAPHARFEEPLARILDERPANFLPRGFQSWNRFLLAQVDATIERLQNECGELAACTWGRANTIRIRHPLSAGLPFLSRFLDMPTLPLPGDDDMPRVQHETFGASVRFAVSPGFEQQGLLAIAGGQSAHPLSPYYRAGFRQWAEGTPVPLLPGPAEHRLVLVP